MARVTVSSGPDKPCRSKQDLERCEGGEVHRSFSNPAINNYFDHRDRSSDVHIAHDRETAKTLAHLTEVHQHGEHVTSMEMLDDQVCQVARRLEILAQAQRRKKLSKRSSERGAMTQAPSMNSAGSADYEEEPLYKQWLAPSLLSLAAIVALIICIAWSESGNLHQTYLHQTLDIAHVHSLRTRIGNVKSPLYTASSWPGNMIELHGRGSEVFDVRLVLMVEGAQKLKVIGQDTRDINNNNTSDNNTSDDNEPDSDLPVSPQTGVFHYELLADGIVFHSKDIALSDVQELEIFESIDVPDKVGHNRAKNFKVHAWAETADGQPIAFLCQVLQMGALARYRFVIGALIFVLTFGFIISEVIHRVYSAFIGTMVLHLVTAVIQEAPRFSDVATTIDFATLMLLFSMMIMMHMLSLTGFFEWFVIKLVGMSRRSPIVLFFLVSNAAGVLSAFLDNTTVTLLTGPLAFSLAEKTGLKPMPLYLAITIAASIGGTATLIGDPPNILIASKMNVGFHDFLMFNGPLALIMLPLSTALLYWQFRDGLVDKCKLDFTGRFDVDMERLRFENQIIDTESFRGVMAILIGMMLALLLTPLHEIQPAWITMFGMIFAAVLYHRDNFEDLLNSVEWDTLLFFAIIFVFVEGMSELGCTRAFGDYVVEVILAVPEDSRKMFTLALFIWVSALGSSFLESLPYTATIISLLQDLQHRNLPGVDINALTWSLSVGACVGGIGTIMGSSTNLTAVAISEGYAKNHEDKVLGWHFLRYGFPLLIVLTTVAMLYHWLIFVGFDIKA